MRRMLLLGVLLASVVAVTIGQPKYRTVSVKDVQIVPLDSLKQCDVLQTGQPARWLLQTSPYFKAVATQRETVEVVGQVVVPPKVVTFTGAGFTVLLRDTSKATASGQWSGLFCRVGSTDTTSLINQGFLGLKPGDVIRIRGWVDEFPNGPSGSAYSGSMVSATQFVPIGGLQLIDEGKPVPRPVPLDLGTFYRGTYPGGSIRWSTGEVYEAAYVEFTNLTVTSIVNATNGTFSVVDVSGNEVAMLDVSKWFTSRGHKDPLSTYKAPSVFQKIDTIRGYITTNSGTEEPRGYRIAPVFPGDVVYGKFLPGIGTHRRNNVVLGPNDTARISVKAFVQTGAVGKIAAVLLKKSLNNGPFTVDSMKYNAADTTYVTSISPQTANTLVKYFFQAYDTSGSYSTYASSATGSASSDTSKGTFFYNILNRPLTIADVQYTPFLNGRTGISWRTDHSFRCCHG